MFDGGLRAVKDRALRPLVTVLRPIPPVALTGVGLAVGLASAGAAGLGWWGWALGLWLANRTLDGLDGLVARATGKVSDWGGYLDLVADFVVYAAVPLAIALNQAQMTLWAVVAVLLATYYVNSVSWLALSALLVRRNEVAETSLPMPKGLIEGFETIVLYSAALAWPSGAIVLFSVAAGLVALTVVLRVFWARRRGLK